MGLEAGGLKIRGGLNEPEEPGAGGALDGGIGARSESAGGGAAQAADPEAEGWLKGGLEGFKADQLEAGGFGGFQFAGEGLKGELAAERDDPGRAKTRGAGDAVHEEQAAGDEQVGDGGEAVGEIGGGNLLEEADVGDFVEGLGAEGGGTEIASINGAAKAGAGAGGLDGPSGIAGVAGQPAGSIESGDAAADGVRLGFAGGEGEDVRGVVAGGVEGEGSPAAGEIEQAVAGLEAKGEAGATEGFRLGGQSGGVGVAVGSGAGGWPAGLEAGAGVAEERAEPGLEEIDGEIERAGSAAPVGGGGTVAGLEAAGEVEAEAAEVVDEGAAEAFGVVESVFGHGEEGGEVALDVEITVEKGAGEGGFGGIAEGGVEAFAGGEGGGKDGRAEGGEAGSA